MFRKNNHSINLISVLIITGIFAISVFLVLIFSINTYSKIVKKSEIESNQMICLSYITAKIHRNDVADSIYIDNFFDIPALYIEETYDGVNYLTIIYAYDGWIRELFFEKGLEFKPENGTAILEAESLTFSYFTKNLLHIIYTDIQGTEKQIYLNLRSKGDQY